MLDAFAADGGVVAPAESKAHPTGRSDERGDRFPSPKTVLSHAS
jgi:hypothetical protein